MQQLNFDCTPAANSRQVSEQVICVSCHLILLHCHTLFIWKNFFFFICFFVFFSFFFFIWIWSIFFFLKDFIYLFIYLFILEKGKGRRKRGKKHVLEKHRVVASRMPPTRAPGPQPRHVSWLGIEPTTLQPTGWHSMVSHTSQGWSLFLRNGESLGFFRKAWERFLFSSTYN